VNRLLEIMRKLRAPDGCPWDREQTHGTLRRHLLEEAYEAVEAAGAGDADALAEELGDVLLQVAFHAVIAEETGTFRYEDVEARIVEKLIRRHPHVFGDVNVTGSDEVIRNWEAIKASEREGRAAPDDVPASMPVLARAARLDGLGRLPAPGESGGPRGRAYEHLLGLLAAASEAGEDVEVLLREILREKLIGEPAGRGQ
jgi:XTP/dITP diphosphohydrolase